MRRLTAILDHFICHGVDLTLPLGFGSSPWYMLTLFLLIISHG